MNSYSSEVQQSQEVLSHFTTETRLLKIELLSLNDGPENTIQVKEVCIVKWIKLHLYVNIQFWIILSSFH